MTDAEAADLIRNKTAAAAEPALTAAEVTSLVALSRVTDPYGLVPGDPGYVPTHDTDLAAAEGWRWKAGKVVAGYDLGADGSKLTRSQVHAHCLAMALEYDKRSGWVGLQTGALSPNWVVNL